MQSLIIKIDQMMEYRHLIKYQNPKIRAIWIPSADNEIGRLFQGVGEGEDYGQRIKDTDAFSLFNVKRCQMQRSKM